LILVDIIVPSIDKKYDFFLDGKTAIHIIIREICEMISQKEHCLIAGDKNELILCSLKDHRVLVASHTLIENRVSTGDSLILV